MKPILFGALLVAMSTMAYESEKVDLKIYETPADGVISTTEGKNASQIARVFSPDHCNPCVDKNRASGRLFDNTSIASGSTGQSSGEQ